MNTLKRTRLLKEVSQGKLAADTGLSRQVISNLERGTSRGYPETWQRIAKVLDVTVDELLEIPKAEPHRERPRGQPAGALEDSESDPLARIVRLLSAWGKEIAESGASSADLQRGLDLVDDTFDEALRAYRARLEQGEEAVELARVLSELSAASVAVMEALMEAAAREPDLDKRTQIIDFLDRPRSARSPASRRNEGRARSAS